MAAPPPPPSAPSSTLASAESSPSNGALAVAKHSSLPAVLAHNASLMRDIRSEFTEVSLLAALAERRRRIDAPVHVTPTHTAPPAPQSTAGTMPVNRSPAAPATFTPPKYTAGVLHPFALPTRPSPATSPTHASDPLSVLQAILASMPAAPPPHTHTHLTQPPVAPVPAAPQSALPLREAPRETPRSGGSHSGSPALNLIAVSDRLRESISRLEAATARPDAHGAAGLPSTLIRVGDVNAWAESRIREQHSPLATETMRVAATRALTTAVGPALVSVPPASAPDLSSGFTQSAGMRSVVLALPSSADDAGANGVAPQLTTATGIMAMQTRATGLLSVARRHMLGEPPAPAPSSPGGVAAAITVSAAPQAPLTISSSIARALTAAASRTEPTFVTSSSTTATSGAATHFASSASAPSADADQLARRLISLQTRLAAIQTPSQLAEAERAAAGVEADVAKLEQRAGTVRAAPAPAATSMQSVTKTVASPPPPPPAADKPNLTANGSSSQPAADTAPGKQLVRLRSRAGESYSEMLAAGVAAPGGALPDLPPSAPESVAPADEQVDAEGVTQSAANSVSAKEGGGFMSKVGKMLRKSLSFRPGSASRQALLSPTADPPGSIADPDDVDAAEAADVVMAGEQDHPDVIVKGFLMKCNGSYRFWQTRYCVLTSRELIYFARAEDADKELQTGTPTRRGAVDLEVAHVFLGHGRAKTAPTRFAFRVATGRRDFVFAAKNEDTRMRWIGALVAVTHGDLNAVLAGTAFSPDAVQAAGVDLGDIDMDGHEDAAPIDHLEDLDLATHTDVQRTDVPGASSVTEYTALQQDVDTDEPMIPRPGRGRGPPHLRAAPTVSFRV